MTSHLVETVRDIPLIVEREPMHVDYDDDDEFDEVDDDVSVCDSDEDVDVETLQQPVSTNKNIDINFLLQSGFPFDREPTRRTDSVLEDIARRHPEFAEHLGDFNLGRRNREPPTSRFTDRPFGTRFGANFPFDRDTFFEDDFHNIPRQQQSPQQQQQQQQQKQPNQETQGQSEVKSENSSSVNQQKSAQPSKIQQSNTVDLGQKQEPINDRNQRSMSAPPTENRGQQPRFFSSINIPINKEGRMEDMGGSQSQQTQQPQQQSPQPSQQQSSQNRPTERVIPIHVEGRDEPVIPKHAGPSFTQQPPQPERIFTGQRPSHFQQFREPRQFASPQYQYYQHPPQQQQPQPSQQPPQPSQQQNYQQQQQQKFQQQQQQQPPPKQEEPAAASPPPQPKTPIDVIQSIQKDVSELMAQIEQFNGKPKDKQYLYLDEMLTRNLIKLDNVDTQGQENIRQARKEAIKCIQKSISILEAKAAANVGESTPSNTESAESTTTTEQKMETEPVSSTTQEAAEPTQTSDEKSETNKMEVQTSEVTTTENKEPSVSTTEEKMDVEAANNQETKEAESTTTMTPQQQQESTSDSQQTKKSQ